MRPFEHDPKTVKILRKTLGCVANEPDPLTSARSITRGTTIVGLMLEHLGDRRGGWKKPGGAVTRFGQVAWGLVELAAPRSLGQVLFQHWIAITYALALLMLLVGVLTDAQAVTRAGYLVLGVAVLVNIVVEKLRRWMETKDHRQLRWVFLVIPLFLSIVSGGISVTKISGLNREMEMQGAKNDLGPGRLAGALKSAHDVNLVLGSSEGNRIAMIRSLNWDSILIASYVTCFLSLGWLVATQFNRPYRAFTMIVISTAVTAVSDVIENYQAYEAIQGATFAPIYSTQLKLGAAGFTVALLLMQILFLLFERAFGKYRSR